MSMLRNKSFSSLCSVCKLNVFPPARPYTVSELITIVIVAVVLVVMVVSGVIACFLKAYGSREGLEPLLEEHFPYYSDDHKF